MNTKRCLLIFLIICSCQPGNDKKANLDNFTFKTGDDTEIFFKNVRQSSYDLEENKAAHFNVFRYEDRVTATNDPLINLAIVINYLQDEAYLLVEPNDILEDQEILSVIIESSEKQAVKTDTVYLENYNREDMLGFISKIYEGLKHKDRFRIKTKAGYTPLLEATREREAFRITVGDYYRLTRVY